MKILVVSDSHGNFENLLKAYEKTNPDVVISAGDHSKDTQELSYIYPNTYYIVRGNCDFFDRDFDDELIINLGGYNILLAHGHIYFVKRTYERLRRATKEKKCDLAIFGHTHIPYFEKGEIALFNPGALKDSLYGVIEINNGEIKYTHKKL